MHVISALPLEKFVFPSILELLSTAFIHVKRGMSNEKRHGTIFTDTAGISPCRDSYTAFCAVVLLQAHKDQKGAEKHAEVSGLSV